MRSAAFLDWWFAPWRLGDAGPVLAGAGAPPAQRDAYRAWCARAGVPAVLPAGGDAGWQAAALDDGAALRRCCRLYGGLFAAREQDHAVLRALPGDDRRWCLSVALAQPLLGGAGRGGDAERRGVLELAWRLEVQFPGMWPRLRRLLPEAPAAPSPPGAGAAALSAAALARAQRCWNICLARAQVQTEEPHP